MAKFRTRARAVDMLGRQQIAGIPTAISELFKNAHDAYADRAEVDYYRSDGLFVLRDDGLGMTEEEFSERWLVLGTESKLGAAGGIAPPPRDPEKDPRPTLGEKGIGRLAIGVIGPQVLVLTRAKRAGKLGDLVAAFIHWGFFALPGVNLDQIDIPILALPGGTLPSRADVASMVAQAKATFEELRGFADDETAALIEQQLESFDVDPEQLDRDLGSPSLRGDGHGTHFIISPADESLATDIDHTDDPDTAPPLLKALIGFTNTMTPDHTLPPIRTAFRDHKTLEDYDDLIAEHVFFTPEEFGLADHHIAGTFDEFGQFAGTVAVYQQPPVSHVVSWPDAKGRQAECGPFRINLAVVQGEARATLVAPEEYQRLVRKMNMIGGLYIYKDGVRVLPYGNTDYDFLNIERNRTKSAYYYYFSFRRMFGVIEIDRIHNRALSEKAGREGFRESKAYRQFRDILENFFVQTAADFFRDEGAHADTFQQTKKELDRVYRAKARREQQVLVRRKAFAESVARVLGRIEGEEPQQLTATVLAQLDRNVRAASAIGDPDRAAAALLDAEAEARRGIRNVREEFTVRKPRGVTPSAAVRRDWEALTEELRTLDQDVFGAAEAQVDAVLGDAIRATRSAVDRRRRLERAVAESIDRASRATRSETQQTKEALTDVESRVGQLTRDVLSTVDDAVKRAQTDLARLDVSPLTDAEFAAERERLEELVVSTAETQRRVLEHVAEQLRRITWDREADGDVLSALDIEESLEEEVEALRERSMADLELAQLGMAIDVISHEFEGTIKTVRGSLKRLKAWADANKGLRELYGNLRTSFEHLDGYLTLFTPLHRRLYRQEVEITGGAIRKFLGELFVERLQRHDVTLEATKAFLQRKLQGYPSTFYPVFVNLVDNAIFWLKDRPQPRLIRLDAEGADLLISDTGPGVSKRDREVIFDLGFTRKPGGRGLGLHISRDALARVGYNLTLDPPVKGQGAAFRISPREEPSAS
ncbi:MAG TPA: ATP-binding protein [Thermoanaerobaculia bacterium]|nr:ATP-binding protein [Thermoanaerobaculia bacterium]